MRTISDIYQTIEDNMTDSASEADDVSLNDILEMFHGRAFGIFLFFFSLPAALPLPAVGVGTVLGIPLLFLTVQQAIGRETVWFPKKMREKRVKKTTITRIISTARPWTRRIERLVKPRLEFMTHGLFARLIGIFGFIMTLSVCLPFPMTNTVPSLGIALMSVGVISRDGLAVIAGALIGSLWVCALVLITIFLGLEGIELVKDMIKGYL